jgi:outer membrane immunogenic protein
MAAGFPVKGGYVEPPRPFSWSGFYLGVHGGYGWGSSNWTVNDTTLPVGFASTANPRSRGFLGGIQGGANHQFGNWVAGIEADFSLIDADATSTDPLFAGGVPTGASMTAHSQIDWLATFTGRFGYAFDRSLLYVKGGVAGAEFKDNYSAHSLASAGDFFDGGTQSNTRVGWTAGAGFEYALLNNWTARIEYNYLDFGSKDETFVFTDSTGSIGFNQSIERKLQLVKLGINYKFGGDGR